MCSQDDYPPYDVRSSRYRSYGPPADEPPLARIDPGSARWVAQQPGYLPPDPQGVPVERADLRAALDEAIRVVIGAGNGTTTRSRPVEEWQRLYRLLDDARAALAASPEPGLDVAVKAVMELAAQRDALARHVSEQNDIIAALSAASPSEPTDE